MAYCSGRTQAICDYPFMENPTIPWVNAWDYYLTYPASYYGSQDRPHKTTETKAQKVLDVSTSTTPEIRRIFFCNRHSPHYAFTNFSDYTIKYQGLIYPTSEHLFQAMKFMRTRPDIAEYIRTTITRPRRVAFFARRYEPFARPDWDDIKARKMDLVLELKFTQYQVLRRELLDTGDADLIYESRKNSFWGIRPDGKGRNELGKALMRLRARFLASIGPPTTKGSNSN